jgi:Predicted membrane protein (DUF2207)
MGFDDKALASAVIDMAVKEFLTIKEKNGTFTLQRANGGVQSLAPEEKAAAAKLFSGSRTDDGDDEDRSRDVIVLKSNCSALQHALSEVKKVLHAAEDKIYFFTNQRYLIPGIILSVATVAAMVVFGTGDSRFVFAFISLWLSIWSIAVFFLIRQSFHLWKGVLSGGTMKKVLRQQAATVTLMAIVFSFFEVGALVGLAVATSFLSVLILALLMATNVAFHWLLKAPTRAGRDLLDKIEGFRMFLRAVDGDRLNRLAPADKTPALFEKYLPYAVALDSEQAWAQQFSTVLENARQTGYSLAWYTGADSFAAQAPWRLH